MNTEHVALCQLSLNCASARQGELMDALAQHAAHLDHYSVLSAVGDGRHYPQHSVMERVLGSANRCLIQVLCSPKQLTLLLDALHQRLQHADVGYWVTPVLQAGRFDHPDGVAPCAQP